MFGLPALLAATLLVGVLGTPASSAGEQATCTYDEPSKTVTLTTPSGLFVAAQLSAEGGVISFQEGSFETGGFGPAQPCGTATTSNTDLIRIQGAAGSLVLLAVDQALGAFAPGFTAEPTGVSEIEFEFLPNGFFLIGRTAAPTLARLGTADANVNGDDDVDVTFAGTGTAVGFIGGAGADDLAATGGFGTGDPATVDFIAVGAEGDDLLVAGRGRAELDGDEGNDILVGGSSADVMNGGVGNDRLTGGAGADGLRGEAGKDVLNGGAKNDFLNGGSGRDRCVGGPGQDKIKKCET